MYDMRLRVMFMRLVTEYVIRLGARVPCAIWMPDQQIIASEKAQLTV